MAKLDLSFSAVAHQGELTLGVEYNIDLFDRGRIEQMLAHYERLMAAVANPDTPVKCLLLLSECQMMLLRQAIFQTPTIAKLAETFDSMRMNDSLNAKTKEAREEIA